MDRAPPDWLTRQTYAHRGLHNVGIPENSRAAAIAAMEAGYGIECDIQLSRDNVPMVFHDWELDRLTDERGPVVSKPARELCQVSLRESDQPIWRLTELLDLVDGKVPLLIEIKSKPHFDIASACAATARILVNYGGPFAVMSFDPRAGEWFAKHQPEMARGLVVTDTLDLGFLGAWRKPRALERAQPDFLACDVRDLPNALARLWRESGRPLLTWTVRNRDLADRATRHADSAIAEGEGIG